MQPTPAYRRPRGFTMLEILIVIAIIGIMASAAVIAFGVLGGDRELKDEAERIVAVIEQTQEEAELQGFDVGLRIGAVSYDFLRFDPRRELWIPIVDDDLLGPRELPPGLNFRLWLEGREAKLLDDPSIEDPAPGSGAADLSAELAKSDTETLSRESQTQLNAQVDAKIREKQIPPQIMVLSSGDLNSFELHLQRDAAEAEFDAPRYKVASLPTNTIQLERLDAER